MKTVLGPPRWHSGGGADSAGISLRPSLPPRPPPTTAPALRRPPQLLLQTREQPFEKYLSTCFPPPPPPPPPSPLLRRRRCRLHRRSPPERSLPLAGAFRRTAQSLVGGGDGWRRVPGGRRAAADPRTRRGPHECHTALNRLCPFAERRAAAVLSPCVHGSSILAQIFVKLQKKPSRKDGILLLLRSSLSRHICVRLVWQPVHHSAQNIPPSAHKIVLYVVGVLASPGDLGEGGTFLLPRLNYVIARQLLH